MENLIAPCTKGLTYTTRNAQAIKCICIHRCGVGATSRDITLAFRDTTRFAPGSYTSGKHPYHLIITREGAIEQCLPISYVAPAALKRLNESGIHIALVGDMRASPPTPAQALALIELCGTLQTAFNWKLEVRGHTETAGSSNDPNKECPGAHLNLNGLRATLNEEYVLYLSPISALSQNGVVF